MLRILIIEDDDIIRENLKDILETFNYQIFSHSNGQEGLEAIKQTLPDLILCDIIMPDLNGYDVLKEIQDNPMLPNIPFVFLSAKAEKTDISKGLELGAQGYLVKPFTVNELLNAIKKGLNRSKQ